MKLTFARYLVGLTVLVGTPALAESPSQDTQAEHDIAQRFELLLETIDVVPNSREAFEASFPDAQKRLDAAARDILRSTWQRVRAVTMLSYFPDASTRATLEALAVAPAANLSAVEKARAISADKEVRRQALYTLGRAFGPTGDTSLVRFIEARIAAEPTVEVREHALRSLRWVDHDEARAALVRLSEKGPVELRPLAKQTMVKRDARLVSPRLGH